MKDGFALTPYVTEFCGLETDDPDELRAQFQCVRSFQIGVATEVVPGQVSHWTEAVKTYYEKNKKTCASKACNILAAATVKGVQHGVSTFVPDFEYPWNPKDLQIFDQSPIELKKHVIHVQAPNTLDLMRSFNPFIGFSGMCVCVEGILLALVLLPQQLLSLGTGDFTQYMRGLDEKALLANPAYLLAPGHAVFVPAGHCMVTFGFIGTGETDSRIMQDKRFKVQKKHIALEMGGHCTHVMILNLDLGHKHLDADVKAMLLNNSLTNAGVVPKTLKSSEVYKEYLAALAKEESPTMEPQPQQRPNPQGDD